jgi:hypothetical protein
VTLTVKHVAANAAQRGNLLLLVQIAKQMGANRSQMAGAMATMIQESAAINMQGGDRDSAGLFQQRPSMDWGSYVQVTTPSYAIRKFLTPFLNYCRQGNGLFQASNLVQRSAYPAAPTQWYSESVSNVTEILGSGDYSDATSSGGVTASTQQTRVQPYEFSRGSAQSKESSWDASGRLASEVNWDRFMRGGALWFVSEQWLRNQPPRFAFSQGARGVLTINFDADSRRSASEMTVVALAKRWSVLPGDVVTVAGEGPGDGLWLVHGTRRTLWDDTTEITLKRPAPKLLEPANTTTTVTVGGASTGSLPDLANVPDEVAKVYGAAKEMSDMNIPYSKTQRTLVARPPSADCSSSVSWVLWRAGFPLPGGISAGGWAPVSGAFSGWGIAGEGKHFTLYYSAEHIWMRFHGLPAWRFDTSPWGSGGLGPHLRFTPRSLATFATRRWPDL